jgi:hypothetical protein
MILLFPLSKFRVFNNPLASSRNTFTFGALELLPVDFGIRDEKYLAPFFGHISMLCRLVTRVWTDVHISVILADLQAPVAQSMEVGSVLHRHEVLYNRLA